jgi:hypothetical protein
LLQAQALNQSTYRRPEKEIRVNFTLSRTILVLYREPAVEIFFKKKLARYPCVATENTCMLSYLLF